MKCICITGASQATIEAVAGPLRQAGMQAPLPLTRDTPIDMAAWHDQVIACARDVETLGLNAMQESGSDAGDRHFSPISSPGRLWEQLASDLFLANLKTPLWGWGHTASTWLLDYWLAFEARLNFVLVCQTPEQMVASALASDTSLADIDALMHAWHAWHEHMLRFYNHNPQRCLLVNADDGAQNPAALVERCRQQWKLPLVSPDQFSTIENLQTPLSLHLARQVARSYPQTGSLQQELDATLTRLDPAVTITLATLDDTASLIGDYRQLREQTPLLQQALLECEQLRATRDKLEQEIRQLQQSALAAEQQYEADKKTWANANTALKAQAQAQPAPAVVSQDSVKLKEAEQENELLLLQLHQVQEELEHYFLQHQDVQKQLQVMQAKMDRLLQRSPGYVDYAAVEVVDADTSGGATWRITDLDAGSRTFDELQFKSIVQHGVAGLVLPCQPGTDTPLIRWPAAATNLKELTILTVGSRSDIQRRKQILLDLATSDWDLLHTLARLLDKLLAQPAAALNAPVTFEPGLLREGIRKLEQFFSDFPDTLRYDTVSLRREQVNPDYEHLWLHFDNLAYGAQRWPHFEFRLSCAGIRPGQFGHHPKLEFPAEAASNPLESWFDESSDDFGAKLELRFALPDAMDMGIWKRLSPHDQRLLKGLIERLPAILTTLQNAGVYISRPWEDWQKLAADIVRITSASTAAPAAPRHTGENPSPNDATSTRPVPRRTGESRYPGKAAADSPAARRAGRPPIAASKAKSTKAKKAERAQ